MKNPMDELERPLPSAPDVACRNADTGEFGALSCLYSEAGMRSSPSDRGGIDCIDYGTQTREFYPGSGHPEMKPYVLHV